VAGGVIYLDIDDEITSAAARIRSVDGRRVAVVLPYGSRVATSRINFRLLARDAMTHEKRLSIVAGDAATRALAASAGLPVFASVGEYESSIDAERGARPTDHPLEASETVVTAGAAGVAAAAITGDGDPVPSDQDLVKPRPAARPDSAVPTAKRTIEPRTGSSLTGRPDAAATPEPVTPSRSEASGRHRRTGRAPIAIGLAVLALFVLVGAVGAYLLLPSATVVVTPREESIGPLPLRIIASPDVSEPDVEAGVVPAETLEVAVEASGSFPATGRRVEESTATGVVRFDNLDPTSTNRIAKGAVVSTASGVRFRTDEAITVPRAELVGLQIFPAQATVSVTAVEPGPEGNVEPNTILTIPRGEEPLFLKVTNPDPTTGGTREEFPRVVQEDVDAALAALTEQLGTAFTDRLDDPDLASGDVTVFPETGELGMVVPNVDPATLVGQEAESFELGASATGTVTTVDAAPVRLIAEARLQSSVEPGHELVEGSSQITEAPAIIEGDTITYPVVVTARQIAVLDPAALEAQILGRSLGEARDILGAYGDVDLEVWPEWVATIPTLDARVEVTVRGPVTVETEEPEASP
jgi:hypothetical protein